MSSLVLQMKKFLRNIDKHKNDQSKSEKAISKLTTQRGILKDGRCGPECTGDNAQGEELAGKRRERGFFFLRCALWRELGI